MSRELRSGEWPVASSGYGLVTTNDGATPFISSVPGEHPFEVAEEAERYKPLLTHVGLFLKFARLAEEEINAEIVLEWADSYGLLGLSPIDRSNPRAGRLNNPWGGEQDTVESFATEARLAHRVLRLYEAAMDTEGVDTGLIASLRGSYRMPKTSRHALRKKREEGKLEDHLRTRSSELLMEMSRVELADWAVNEVEHLLWIQLAAHTYPQPHRSEDGSRKTAWGFRNLLGALWLQMLWLWEHDYTKIRRCQQCGRVIEDRSKQARNCAGRSCRDKHSRRGTTRLSS